MGLSNITFNIQNGGLNRVSASEDPISGLLAYTVNATGSTTATLYKSLQEMETAGITKTSNKADVWYSAKNYFLQYPNGQIYVKLASSGTTTFTEILDIQREAEGKIRQILVLNVNSGISTADITTMQNQVNILESEYAPVSIIYQANQKTFNVTGATDLRSGAFGCPAISVVLGADADGEGYSMTSGNTYDFGYGSVVLGQVSRNQVHRSPAYVALNNVLSYTTDFTKIKIGNTDYNAITKANLDILSDKGYIFPRKFNNVVGTFTSSAHVATTSTDDVNSIQTKRTLSKAIRFVYQSLVQQLNSTVDIDPTTGKINILSVQNLELIAGEGLESMQKAGEVSGYKVFIDPDQNILSTGLLNVNISIVPTGTIEQITVNIGFVATI